MRIALDAMGGDHAPGPVVAGAARAVAADPDLHVLLVGNRSRVEPFLAAQGLPERVELLHASQTIAMDEAPVRALRRKADNSISRCWQLLADHQVDALVSAGSTGAIVAGAFQRRCFLASVHRPGIAALMPTVRGPCVLIDVGANISPRPEHLFQYGLMGSVLARHVLLCPEPTIGLMNVGAEEQKGHDLAQKTHALFNASPLRGQFVGNVEGRDLHHGAADVVVCDGFAGNVVLKACEGLFQFLMQVVAVEVVSPLRAERPLAQQGLQDLLDRYDYSAHGGAPLLGVDGVCIICHGSSTDRAIQNALAVAGDHVRARLSERVAEELTAAPVPGSGE